MFRRRSFEEALVNRTEVSLGRGPYSSDWFLHRTNLKLGVFIASITLEHYHRSIGLAEDCRNGWIHLNIHVHYLVYNMNTMPGKGHTSTSNLPQTLPVLLLISLLWIVGPLPADEAELTIRAQMGMKYDTLRFQVSPGQEVRVRLVNVDEIPHNIVFTESGKRLVVVRRIEEMGAKASSSGYAPDLEPILAAIPVVDGGEEESLTFTAPEKTGVYPYVCTFPGHGYTMYGAMYVGDQTLPALAEDPHVPDRSLQTEQPKNDAGEGLNLPHAFTARRPFMYRIKMPDATQAAIAVALRNGQNYCWDAGRQRFRYAWAGEFVDPMPNFSGKGHTPAKVLGDIYYRSHAFPLRFGDPDNIPQERDFKGYRMKDGVPAFEVTMDGVRVQHLITSRSDGAGIERRFRIKGAQQPVWFVMSADDGVEYSSPDGTFSKGGRLKLSPEEAQDFRVRIVPSTDGGQ